jgi:hypothetical protein
MDFAQHAQWQPDLWQGQQRRQVLQVQAGPQPLKDLARHGARPDRVDPQDREGQQDQVRRWGLGHTQPSSALSSQPKPAEEDAFSQPAP